MNSDQQQQALHATTAPQRALVAAALAATLMGGCRGGDVAEYEAANACDAWLALERSWTRTVI